MDGDWVTIAVVAERGPIKFSKAPVGIGREDEDPKSKGKGKKPNDNAGKPHGKKYVNLKLIDFGCRTSSSNTGGQAKIRGDAFLTLLLFESDGFDVLTERGETKGQKIYKGGSRGAFESMAKLKEGAVVALLNPKILKPFQVGSSHSRYGYLANSSSARKRLATSYNQHPSLNSRISNFNRSDRLCQRLGHVYSHTTRR